MASLLNDSARNVMLDQFGTVAIWASLHTANPGSTGTSEVTGGSPAYARKSITWSAASASSKASNNAPLFDVPPNTTVTHTGFWSASTGGTFYGYLDITDEAYVGQGTYTLNSATITAAG